MFKRPSHCNEVEMQCRYIEKIKTSRAFTSESRGTDPTGRQLARSPGCTHSWSRTWMCTNDLFGGRQQQPSGHKQQGITVPEQSRCHSGRQAPGKEPWGQWV